MDENIDENKVSDNRDVDNSYIKERQEGIDNNTLNSAQVNSMSGAQKSYDNQKSGVIHRFIMDKSGNIKSDKSGTAVVAGNTKIYIILGWICAALTAFISPLFAAGGIVFGALANRNVRGSGNALIITNIFIAIINLIFGLFITAFIQRIMFA